MDLKKAYELLELPEDSSIEEVEKRFDVLVRRMRGNNTEESAITIKAYKVIKEFERQGEIEQYNEAKFGTNTKKRHRSDKIETFWLNHRWKVLASVASILILVMVLNIVIKNIKIANMPKPNLEVMMYGEYYGGDDEELGKGIVAKFPDWQRVKGIINYLPSETSGAMDPAYVQKSFVVLATERPDIYILDKVTFKTMLDQNALSPIDSIRTELSAVYSSEQLLEGKQKDDTETHLYGVVMTDNPFWKAFNLELNDKIAVLRINPKNPDNAKRFLLTFN